MRRKVGERWFNEKKGKKKVNETPQKKTSL